MAASRSKRHNAGKNIGKLLDQELDADDFYKTAYGGFEDTLEDGVYQSEDSDDDEVDSDFDAPEQEGIVRYMLRISDILLRACVLSHRPYVFRHYKFAMDGEGLVED